MAALEKAEAQLERANMELSAIQEKKADILEKEKIALKKVEDAENNRILQIVSSYNLGGNELKKKLASITHKPELKNFNVSINDERKNENEKNN